MPKAPPAAVVALTQRARFGLRGLERKMAPPSLAVLDFISDLWSFQIVYAFTDLRVADALAAGARPAADVARELGLNEDALYRLLRAASNLDLVREEAGRAFSLRPIGNALVDREAESFRDFIVFMGRVGYRFWGRLTDSVRQGKSAIEIETGKTPFELLLGDDETRALFNRAMTAISNISADAFVAAYDLAGFQKIVDVGGGHGRLLSAILADAASARGVLFDLPEVVRGAPAALERFGARERIEIVGGSFFDSVPEGGDLYVMKSVLHDWQDEEAFRILSSVRTAAPPKSKLALFEAVIPAPNTKHFAKFLDLEMLVQGGGRERTEEEFAALLQRAGFRLSRVIGTAGPASIVEAEPV